MTRPLSIVAACSCLLLQIAGCGGGNQYVEPQASDTRAREIQADPKELIPRLKNDNPGARTLVIGALERLGPKAKEALPELEKIQQSDPVASVREAAERAITAIKAGG
jgi:hypothetical protein